MGRVDTGHAEVCWPYIVILSRMEIDEESIISMLRLGGAVLLQQQPISLQIT